MFRPRVIPVLLLRNKGLVKSIKFSNHKYIGDPINAIKILNDLKADELAFLDINATRENRTIEETFIRKVGEEANMPFAVGGGINTLEKIRTIIEAGAEKVIINTAAINPGFINAAATRFGSSTIAVCIDVKKNLMGTQKVYIRNGTKSVKNLPLAYAKYLANEGAGEIILQSIDKDGTLSGYDLELIREISNQVSIPIIALGGAGCLDDMVKGYHTGSASALAAGSIFVYQGIRRSVLINYPSREQLSNLFNKQK